MVKRPFIEKIVLETMIVFFRDFRRLANVAITIIINDVFNFDSGTEIHYQKENKSVYVEEGTFLYFVIGGDLNKYEFTAKN